MGAVDQQSIFNCLLTGFFRVKRRHQGVNRRQDRVTTAPRSNTSAGGSRINIEATGHRKRGHVIAHQSLVFGLDNHVKGMLPPRDRLAMHREASLAKVRAAEVVQQISPAVRIGSGTVLWIVLMANNKKRHISTRRLRLLAKHQAGGETAIDALFRLSNVPKVGIDNLHTLRM